MSFQSPFDQPSYKAKPKKKAAKRKKSPAKKKAKKKRAAKKAPARKKAAPRKEVPAKKKVTHTRSGGITQAQFDTIGKLAGHMNTWDLTNIIKGLIGKPHTPWHLTKAQATKVIKHLKSKKAPRPGFPHENIRAGQHWSFVCHAQYGYLITHGRVISERGGRCHVKPAKGAASAWVQASPHGKKPPSISRAGAMVECHAPGDLVRSRLIEPYTSKAQFAAIAAQLAEVYKRHFRHLRRGPEGRIKP